MTTTVNYSWALPTVGASVNTWGTLVNNILIDIDAKMFSRTGGPISGNVSVAGTLSLFDQINNTGTGVLDIVNRNGTGIDFYVNAASLRAGRFDASGNLLVGTSSAVGNEKFNVTGSVANNIVRVINTNAAPSGILLSYSQNITGTGNEFIDCRTNTSTQVFKVMANGNVANINNSYGAISSKLYKENIADASPKLAKLLKVRIVNYNLINDPAKLKQIGVIWEELNEISPGMCGETPDYEEVTLTREVEKTVPVTIKKEVTTERVQFDVIDGVAVQKIIKETAAIDEPVVDEYPVFDGYGNPVMEVVTPATEAEIDDKGNEVKPASPAVLRQKIHTVPRMETVVEKEEYTERRLTGTTTKSVKYSIFVPMLIKAMQEQQAQIEALKAKVGA